MRRLLILLLRFENTELISTATDQRPVWTGWFRLQTRN